MIKHCALAALAAFSLTLTACEEKATPTAPKPATPTPATKPADKPAVPAATAPTGMIDSAKEKAAAAASGVTAATTEMRDKLVAAFSSKYDEFKMQISTLQEKAKDVPAQAKTAFDGAMTSLNTMTKDVEAKLVELKNASGDAVKKLQDSVEGAWPKIQEQISAAEKALTGK